MQFMVDPLFVFYPLLFVLFRFDPILGEIFYFYYNAFFSRKNIEKKARKTLPKKARNANELISNPLLPLNMFYRCRAFALSESLWTSLFLCPGTLYLYIEIVERLVVEKLPLFLGVFFCCQSVN